MRKNRKMLNLIDYDNLHAYFKNWKTDKRLGILDTKKLDSLDLRMDKTHYSSDISKLSNRMENAIVEMFVSEMNYVHEKKIKINETKQKKVECIPNNAIFTLTTKNKRVIKVTSGNLPIVTPGKVKLNRLYKLRLIRKRKGIISIPKVYGDETMFCDTEFLENMFGKKINSATESLALIPFPPSFPLSGAVEKCLIDADIPIPAKEIVSIAGLKPKQVNSVIGNMVKKSDHRLKREKLKDSSGRYVFHYSF